MRAGDEHGPGRLLAFRSRARKGCVDPASGAAELMMRVGRHVEQHVGPIAQTLHHDSDHPMNVVLFHVPPSADRPFHSVVTAGMSHLAMKPPRGAEDCTHAELVVLLRPEWDLTPEGLRTLRNAWPLREL